MGIPPGKASSAIGPTRESGSERSKDPASLTTTRRNEVQAAPSLPARTLDALAQGAGITPNATSAPDDELRLQNDSLPWGIGILDSFDQHRRRPSAHLSTRHSRRGDRWIHEACLGYILVSDEREASARKQALPRQAVEESDRDQIVVASGGRRTRSESRYPAGGSIPFPKIGSRRPDERAVEGN